jgi:hypothetical protein
MGGNNENKSESGALQKFLPVGEATDQISQAASAPSACVGWFCSS